MEHPSQLALRSAGPQAPPRRDEGGGVGGVGERGVARTHARGRVWWGGDAGLCGWEGTAAGQTGLAPARVAGLELHTPPPHPCPHSTRGCVAPARRPPPPPSPPRPPPTGVPATPPPLPPPLLPPLSPTPRRCRTVRPRRPVGGRRSWARPSGVVALGCVAPARRRRRPRQEDSVVALLEAAPIRPLFFSPLFVCCVSRLGGTTTWCVPVFAPPPPPQPLLPPLLFPTSWS